MVVTAMSEISQTSSKKSATQIIDQQALGHARRIQGVDWDEDSSGVYVTAISHMVKFRKSGIPVEWQRYAANYVDIEAVSGTGQTVMVTPTFSEKNRSGGLSVIDEQGNIVRSVELPDMSPYVVVVSP